MEIPNPWSWVNFTLQLANGERGRFTHLVMLRHSSVSRNDARAGRCHHSVKSTDFFTVRIIDQYRYVMVLPSILFALGFLSSRLIVVAVAVHVVAVIVVVLLLLLMLLLLLCCLMH